MGESSVTIVRGLLSLGLYYAAVAAIEKDENLVQLAYHHMQNIMATEPSRGM